MRITPQAASALLPQRRTVPRAATSPAPVSPDAGAGLYMLAPGRPMPAHDPAAFAFEQSCNYEPTPVARVPDYPRIGFASALDAETAN